jgi:dihydroneopterin aldolase
LDRLIRSQKVLVRGLKVDAFIGVHDHEKSCAQPLVIDVEIDLAPHRVEGLEGTFNYETVVAAALEIIASGHIDLVETFAERLASACIGQDAAQRVRVCILKPMALAPQADAAGVELVLERAAT